MSATAATLTDFADAFAAKTNSLHPAGAVTVAHWLDDMRAAAEAERPARVAEPARMVTDKVALERRWYAEDVASIARLKNRRPAV